ncbi:hypothetical protein DEIPH_ctg032orf0040 [Deinococcus phoenicis]|uniref:Uncharacterized protein n=1 Tax=Deinococcus phoenicis TaxID=1476583 RepID=A0A016QPT5_9DEIO|nr:hypothetical protein DEIPH_ctg032orf0040 [Deinococcus phoenicis]
MLVVLGALAWFLVIQPARTFLDAWRAPAQTQTQPQTGAATPPAPTGNVNAPLTKADVERFVRVRRDIRDALGTSFTGLQQVWTDIQNGQTPNLWTVTGVLRDAGTAIGNARQAQAAALAREELSLERYAAVRSAVNRALGVPNVDFAQAAQALQSGRLPDLNTSVQTATAQEKALVAPHRAELTQTAALGLLGL